VDFRHFLPILIIGGGMSFTAAILYGAWMLGRYRGREEGTPPEIASLEARLYRVEQSMSDVTNALNRLEAAHRLTARMLTDQAPSEPARLPRRAVTPH
jgi:hypothetical protein